jgi:membrane-associated protein
MEFLGPLFGDVGPLIKSVGYLGIFFIVFAESGLFFGFFLPGDSLLFTSGFLASQGFLDLTILLIGSFIAAVIGDSVGYAFGKKVGPSIFRYERSRFFNPANVRHAQAYYARYGAMTIIIARFLPIIRTFAPILAGVAHMRYARFFAMNVIGALLWAIGLTLAGYFLGSFIPDADRYLFPIIMAIIIASFIPGVWHVLRDPVARQALKTFFSRS